MIDKRCLTAFTLWIFVGFFGLLAYMTPEQTCKDDELVLNIISLRVDDDGEYHITGSSVKSGVVSSFADMYGDRLIIKYTNTDKPQMFIPISSCVEEGRSFYTYRQEDRRIELPVNYKIETFDD